MLAKFAANPDAPRLLLVRLSAIGDVIQAMPVACALRDAYPRAFLSWVVEEPAGSLLRGHRALNEVIVLPPGWLKSPGTVWWLRNQLRARKFDLAIDAQGLTKSAVAAWVSGARRRLGFGDPLCRELSGWFNTELVSADPQHVVERNLRLLKPLGITSPAVRFDIADHQAERLAMDEMLRFLGYRQGFAIINPGAGWPSKYWPTSRFAAVARYLARTWDLPSLVVWAGPREQAMAQAIVAGSAGHAWAAPATSLTELAALARRCRLFISSDTGPLHLAAAVEAPCIGLYGPWPAARHGPYGKQHVALQEMVLEGSTRQRRHAPPIYMEAIKTELVCRACDQVLQRERLVEARDTRAPVTAPPRVLVCP